MVRVIAKRFQHGSRKTGWAYRGARQLLRNHQTRQCYSQVFGKNALARIGA